MSFWTLDRLTQALEEELRGARPEGHVPLGRVVTDTRIVAAGDVLIALIGERFDAHDFLAEAVQRGAVAVVVSDPRRAVGLHVPVYVVDDTTRALAALGRYRRRAWGGPIVAVAGVPPANEEGTFHVSVDPDGVSVPGPLHAYSSEEGDVSLSATDATTCTVSSMSAKPDGWLLRDPMLRNAVMAGGRFAPLGATNVNPPDSVEVLPPDVTDTSAAPGVGLAAVVAVTVLVPETTTLVADTPPMVTVVSLPNPAPVIVTVLPPVVLPVDGDTVVTFTELELGPDGESDPHAAARTGTSRHRASRRSERKPN